MSRPDPELLVRAQEGDPVAFEQLVAPHVDSVRRFAYSFVRNWVDADDLAQESLLKAFRSIRSYQGKAALSTWLFAVTRSVCLDWYKTRQAKTKQLETDIDQDLPDDSESPQSLLECKVSAEQLWTVIRQLKVEFRTPLVLYDIEGLPYDEIARIERVKIGTVRSRLSRARRLVAKGLFSQFGRDIPPDPNCHGTISDRRSSSSLAESAT